MEDGTTGTVAMSFINVRRPNPGQSPKDGAVVALLPLGTLVSVVKDFGDGWPFIQSGSGASQVSGYIDQTNVNWATGGIAIHSGGAGGSSSAGDSDNPRVPNSYPNLNVIPYAKTILSMSEFIGYLTQQGDVSNEVKCALYTMWAIESAYGKAGINNNYGGFQADSGKWPSKYDKLITATCVKTDSGGNLRRFVCFADWQSCVTMFKQIIVDRGLYVGGTTDGITEMLVNTPERWVLAYYREWVTGNASASPSSKTVSEIAALYHEAEVAIGAVGNLNPEPQAPPQREMQITTGDRNALINLANNEGAQHLVWSNANDVAEKYLAPLRPAMQELGQIGTQPVFYDWCGAFVTWCCRHAGYQIPDQPRGFWATMAFVDAWKYWAAQNGTLVSVNSAGFAFAPGDILLFQWHRTPASLNYILDHVGICVAVQDARSVISAEGNTDKPGQTDVKTRYLANIAGVIRMPQ